MHWYAHIKGGPQCVNHAAITVGEAIYSFGGYSSDVNYNEAAPIDVNLFNTETLQWSALHYTAESEDAVPMQCFGHSVVAYGQNIYLWGGRNYKKLSTLLYCFDTKNNTWSLPKVCGSIPEPCDGHTACVMDHYMYIFGGYGESDNLLNVLSRIDLRTFRWEIIQTKGVTPAPRDFHTASVIGDKIYFFGGRGFQTTRHGADEDCYYDMIYYDSTAMTWEHLPTVTGDIPRSRRSHSAVVFKGEIYILCGYNSLFDEHFNDIHKFNPETHHWTKLSARGHAPCRRRRQCCCAVGDMVYLFGGISPCHLSNVENPLMEQSDLHILDLFPTLKRRCLFEIHLRDIDPGCLPKTLKNEMSILSIV